MYGSVGDSESLSLIAESEYIGRETLGHMRKQRVQLEGSHAKVEDMRDMTKVTRETLKKMERKAMTKLLCLYSTIVLLSVLILLVLYREVTNHGKLF